MTTPSDNDPLGSVSVREMLRHVRITEQMERIDRIAARVISAFAGSAAYASYDAEWWAETAYTIAEDVCGNDRSCPASPLRLQGALSSYADVYYQLVADVLAALIARNWWTTDPAQLRETACQIACAAVRRRIRAVNRVHEASAPVAQPTVVPAADETTEGGAL